MILTTAPKYAIVSALGPTKGCGAESCAWMKVAYDGVEGWSKGAYFEPAHPIAGTGVANVDLNLRAAADYGGAVLKMIPAGGRVTLKGRQSYPWVYVSDKGTQGLVFADYLTVNPPAQH